MWAASVPWGSGESPTHIDIDFPKPRWRRCIRNAFSSFTIIPSRYTCWAPSYTLESVWILHRLATTRTSDLSRLRNALYRVLVEGFGQDRPCERLGDWSRTFYFSMTWLSERAFRAGIQNGLSERAFRAGLSDMTDCNRCHFAFEETAVHFYALYAAALVLGLCRRVSWRLVSCFLHF